MGLLYPKMQVSAVRPHRHSRESLTGSTSDDIDYVYFVMHADQRLYGLSSVVCRNPKLLASTLFVTKYEWSDQGEPFLRMGSMVLTRLNDL